MNSYSDWKNGYDKDDKYKQHHPLNSGMDPKWAAAISGWLVGSAAGIAVMKAVIEQSEAGVALTLVGFAAGVAYNKVGKLTKHKYLLIATAHSTVFAIPYVTIAGVDGYAAFGTLLMFLWVMYQISISGEVKDITVDEANLLRDEFGVVAKYWAMEEENHLSNTSKAMKWAFLQRVVFTLTALALAFASGSGIFVLSLIGVVGASSAIIGVKSVSSGAYIRPKRMRQIALVEIGSFVVFVGSFQGVIGTPVVLLLISTSALYLFAANRTLWGTWLAPDV